MSTSIIKCGLWLSTLVLNTIKHQDSSWKQRAESVLHPKRIHLQHISIMTHTAVIYVQKYLCPDDLGYWRLKLVHSHCLQFSRFCLSGFAWRKCVVFSLEYIFVTTNLWGVYYSWLWDPCFLRDHVVLTLFLLAPFAQTW